MQVRDLRDLDEYGKGFVVTFFFFFKPVVWILSRIFPSDTRNLVDLKPSFLKNEYH